MAPRSAISVCLLVVFTAFGLELGCSATDSGGKSNTGATGGSNASGGNAGSAGTPAVGGTGGGIDIDASGTGGSAGVVGVDPKTCEEAAQAKTYIGCDFWPTVTANNVWSIFDYAVVVANAGESTADILIEGGGQSQTGQVLPNGLKKFYLPWVPELKGPDADACGNPAIITQTVRKAGGAYHLTSTVPVTVYQFNALEYQGVGGPPGKDWSSCPGNACLTGCYSFSNDASLLIPATALTGNYRIVGPQGWSIPAGPLGGGMEMPPYFSITGTQDGTTVSVKVGGGGQITPGGGVPFTGPGGLAQFPLNRGEVVQVLGPSKGTLAGSLVQADKPIQVISGMPCTNQPQDKKACDHIEETVPPAETLGKRYFVASPTGALGNVVGHIVRIYGNFDNTALTYGGATPPGAPTTLNAGQVVDLGIVVDAFEVSGDKEFAVSSHMLGGTIQDPLGGVGDPAMSLSTPVEQYRVKYVFLAPDDYPVSYADVIVPDGANVVIDGSALPAAPVPVSNGYGIARVKLGPGGGGAHVLVSDKPVGLQVMGFGMYTSYHYPGGLNLGLIAPPPPPVQ